MRQDGSCWSRYEQLIEDSIIILNSLQSWVVGHVGREANEVAHHLMKLALGQSLDQVWMEDSTMCIQNIVLAC